MLQKFYVILAIGAFIINNKGEILIVKKSLEEKIDAGLWTIPGGKIKKKENIVDGLKREIKEEVGIEIVSYQWIGEDVFESNGFWFHAQHFLCQTKSTKVVLEKKLIYYHWLKKEEINKFKFSKNIKKRLLQIYG
ncbi:MAG: NUDIX domain-containing protein [Patescibacteria group bacterium]|nr:NUDIX domain-containing protein [Patescibacteria group bacterium]